MTERERFARTLFDYAPDYQWIRQLGWSDADLQRVPVHEEATAADEMLNLADFGGTSLGVVPGPGSPTSAGARSIPNLYVYRRSTPPELWQRLQQLVQGTQNRADATAAFEPNAGGGAAASRQGRP